MYAIRSYYAQGQKLPVQALVDKVTRVFVPSVMALSLTTFGIWLAAGQGFTPAFIRITSYNVCYTKLLRSR